MGIEIDHVNRVPGRHSVLIRQREDADLPVLAEVLARVHERFGYPMDMPDDPQRWLESARNRICSVATLDGTVVGHVAVAEATGDHALPVWQRELGLPAEAMAVVKRLFVDPGAARLGIGRALLTHAMSCCEREDLVPVLDVQAGSAPARALYERSGFDAVGTVELVTSRGNRFEGVCYVGRARPGGARRQGDASAPTTAGRGSA